MKTPYEVYLETEVGNLRRQLAAITVGDRDALGFVQSIRTGTISPREAQLCEELTLEKWRVQHLMEGQRPQRRIEFDADTIEQPAIYPTVKLAVEGGYRSTPGTNYHVWAKERGATREQFNIGYYITDPAMMTLSDRSAAMAYTLERAVRELSKTMHKEKV